MPTIISASEITVRYGDRAILDATTLGIQEGERLGLVGRQHSQLQLYGCDSAARTAGAPSRGTGDRRMALAGPARSNQRGQRNLSPLWQGRFAERSEERRVGREWRLLRKP